MSACLSRSSPKLSLFDPDNEDRPTARIPVTTWNRLAVLLTEFFTRRGSMTLVRMEELGAMLPLLDDDEAADHWPTVAGVPLTTGQWAEALHMLCKVPADGASEPEDFYYEPPPPDEPGLAIAPEDGVKLMGDRFDRHQRFYRDERDDERPYVSQRPQDDEMAYEGNPVHPYQRLTDHRQRRLDDERRAEDRAKAADRFGVPQRLRPGESPPSSKRQQRKGKRRRDG